MATQRRFEANSLAAVLAKVQKEVGTDATISSAQRVRSGGMLGFFQREKFEVLVTENPAPKTSAGTKSAAAATGGATEEQVETVLSLLDLAEIANTADRNEIKLEQSLPRPLIKEPSTKAPKVEQPIVEQPKVEQPIAEVLKPDPEPQISTETDSFAEVLSRVAFQAHMTEEHEQAQREAAAERARRRDEEIPGRPPFLDAVPTNIARDQPVATPQPESAATPQPVAQPEPEVQMPVDKPAPVQVETQSQELAVPSTRTRVSDHPLATLGLPTEYIPVGVGAEGLQGALSSALERLLPKTPDIRPSKGSVIAIVGDRFDAMEVAEELAEQWGRPAEEIVLASQTYRGKGAANVLRTVRSAEDAQRSWSRRPRPTIVAIEAQPGTRDSSWAEHVLTALEPIATYGVADATRKSDDIKAWAEALGGVDCLAINNIEETVSPAAVLATGIPVERVDGRKVNAAFWALLLTERLTAA